MPTYEYECSKCKKTFETFQSMKDEAFKTCPKELCRMKKWGRGRVKRLLGAGAGLIFKGSGFYITDYRSEGYKAAVKSEKSTGESTGATDAKSKSETTSDPKSETPKKSAETKTKTQKKAGP
jgi:putative FmdB family regulatory protein